MNPRLKHGMGDKEMVIKFAQKDIAYNLVQKISGESI